MIEIQDYAAVEEAAERCNDCERCTFACENLLASRISLNGIACCMRAAASMEDGAVVRRILDDEVIKSAVANCNLCGACVVSCEQEVDVVRLMESARSAYASAGIGL